MLDSILDRLAASSMEDWGLESSSNTSKTSTEVEYPVFSSKHWCFFDVAAFMKGIGSETKLFETVCLHRACSTVAAPPCSLVAWKCAWRTVWTKQVRATG